jgi:hypothetical protein
MRSVRVAIGLAAALLVGGLGFAHAQTGAEDAINSRTEPKARKGVDRTRPTAAPERAVPATRAIPATPGGPDGPATPATPATPADPPRPLVPPGLSGHAPETAPNVGVIGGGSSKGSSPAATPEPSTLLMLGAGLAGVYGLRRRRR